LLSRLQGDFSDEKDQDSEDDRWSVHHSELFLFI